MENLTKICSVCLIEKGLTEFHFRKDQQVYRRSCKACCNAVGRRYYSNHQEKCRSYRVIRRVRFPDKVKAEKKAYATKNAVKISAWQKEWYLKPGNREKFNQWRRQYVARRCKTDTNYLIERRLRARLLTATKKGYIKSAKTFDLLGCSIKVFKEYLFSKFTTGMTEDLFMEGKIQIDHIIPIAAFDLSKEEDQFRCFHYSNLQPLWALDNMLKGSKLNYQIKNVA